MDGSTLFPRYDTLSQTAFIWPSEGILVPALEWYAYIWLVGSLALEIAHRKK
jgi:hypothetical protein